VKIYPFYIVAKALTYPLETANVR